MRSFQRCAAIGGSVMVCALLTAGCGQPVREDRAIAFAPDQRAGFQHGRDGIYIADAAGGAPIRIFQPTADTIAISPPMWSSDGKKLLFTTARSAAPTGTTGPQMPADPVPNGAVYFKRPIIYSCWLRDENAADKTPRKLFDENLDHPGYVAGNLAVRWTPAGDGFLFLKSEGQFRALHLFDLKSSKSRQAFPQKAEAMLFD